MNRVDVPRETAARRPLIRSQTRFSPPLPPILTDNETRHYHARPDNVYSRDPLIVPISSKPLFRDPTTPNPTFPRILFFQKFYLHEIFVRPINSMMKDTRLTLSRQERERELRFPFLPRILLPRGWGFRWHPRKCFPFDATWPLGFAKCGQHQLLP